MTQLIFLIAFYSAEKKANSTEPFQHR